VHNLADRDSAGSAITLGNGADDFH